MKTKILLTFLYFFPFIGLFLNAGLAESLPASFQYSESPSISRFQGFSGSIAPETAKVLDRKSIHVYVNGKEETEDLEIEENQDSGALTLHFVPAKALPLGRIEIQFLAYSVNGTLLERRFSYWINPASDSGFEKLVKAVEENPVDPKAHYLLGQAYEQKRLFQDAAYEYSRVLDYSPQDKEAREAYDRIFAMWGRKKIEKNHVVVDVAIEDALLSMGGPVAFKIKVTNTGPSPIVVLPDASVLINDKGNQTFSLDDINAYLQNEVNEKTISLDQYAQVSYFLETNPLHLLKQATLHSGTSAEGYIVFPNTVGELHRLAFIFAKIMIDEKETNFRFPFSLP